MGGAWRCRVLIVFAGLPGVGKTTLARTLARERGAAYLRIDTIERALAGGTSWAGPEGYRVAYAVAADILAGGVAVVADCVNPLAITRASWRAVARDAGVPLREVEIVCTDPAEHLARLRARQAATGRGPAWEAVLAMEYELWDGARVDTAGRPVGGALADVRAATRFFLPAGRA